MDNSLNKQCQSEHLFVKKMCMSGFCIGMPSLLTVLTMHTLKLLKSNDCDFFISSCDIDFCVKLNMLKAHSVTFCDF